MTLGGRAAAAPLTLNTGGRAAAVELAAKSSRPQALTDDGQPGSRSVSTTKYDRHTHSPSKCRAKEILRPHFTIFRDFGTFEKDL